MSDFTSVSRFIRASGAAAAAAAAASTNPFEQSGLLRVFGEDGVYLLSQNKIGNSNNFFFIVSTSLDSRASLQVGARSVGRVGERSNRQSGEHYFLPVGACFH